MNRKLEYLPTNSMYKALLNSWIKKKRIQRLRGKLLHAKEEQVRHRLLSQHYDDMIRDYEDELNELDALRSDSSSLINLNFDSTSQKEPVKKASTGR